MFSDLSIYRAVIVTGPQRSGTTIAARCMAEDTGHLYIDEEDYGTKDADAWRRIVRDGFGIVVHSPAMARFVHEFVRCDDVCIVWLLRDIDEIMASEQRVGWDGSKERAKYSDDVPPSVWQQHIAQIKLHYWRNVQRPNIKHWREVEYESLAAHPLWVADRKGFGVRQWQ